MIYKDEPEMNGKNVIPLLLSHGEEGFVAQNPCIRNEDVDTSKLAYGGFNESLAILSRADCGSGLTTA
jgi:hypothetical protein